MDIRALHRQGVTYAEIGRLLGRDWRTVKRYLEEAARPVYRRRRIPSKLDPYKPLVDQWLAKEPRLQARLQQDLVRDYGFEGCYQVVRRYVERARPAREPAPVERFETAPGHQTGRLVARAAACDALGTRAAALRLPRGARPLARRVRPLLRLQGPGQLLGLPPCRLRPVRRRPARDPLRPDEDGRAHARGQARFGGRALPPGGARLGAPLRLPDPALPALAAMVSSASRAIATSSPPPAPASGSSSCSQPRSSRSTRPGTARSLPRRGEPARVLPDPASDSVPLALALVLGALPEADVHRRPLSVYEEASRG